jgi:hypothetical protein
LLPRLVYLTLCRSIQLLALLARGDTAKDLEILVLRHQLTVLRRQVSRPRFEGADRALLAAVSRALPRARWSCFLVKPETLLGWHRRLIARAWTYPHHQRGRPPLDKDLQQLIIRLASENPRWGYQRSKGELQRLGVQVSATTIRTMLLTGHRHVEQVLRVYLDHYNVHRPHRALGLEPPDRPAGPTAISKDQGRVHRRDRLGGLLNEYHRQAA